MLSEEEKEALRWAGRLGHLYVVLTKDLQIKCETDTISSARSCAKMCGGTIYRQDSYRNFKKIRFQK